jgi:glycosyltransferase involved in cell wall biosynthesis
MRVTLDVSAVPAHIAGAGRYTTVLSERLPGELELTLASRRDDGARWSTLSSARVMPIVPNNRIARLAYERWGLRSSSVYRASEVWHGPHYTMPHGGTTPSVVTIHDLTFFTNPEWHEATKVAFFRRAIRYAAEHADVLVSVSTFTANVLRELVPSSAPIVVAPHGVDTQRFNAHDDGDEQQLRAANLPSDRPFVLFVGTVEPRKGLEVLLASFVEVGASDAEVELWLAGQAGWGTGAIEQLIEEHPWVSRIRRLGYVDEGVLVALYRRARAVAYPSRGEGFGLPVLEALACGAPVVTSAGTVLEEVAGDSALLTPVGDVVALGEALQTLVALSDGQRQVWAQRAIARAATFTWERSITQHLEAYHLAAGR